MSAFTPSAPFLGNQTGLVGAALKPKSSLAGSLLVRESNCSLTQYSFADTANGTVPSLTKLPGFDAYAHKISGLTTPAGAFPKGCADRRFGTPSTPGTYLGRASNGDLLAVSVNDGSGQITLLRSNVQGTYLSTTALGPTGAASTVAAADLNGDGIADIVTPFITSGGVSGIGVFLSRPDGSYGPVTVYPGYPADAKRFARVSIEDINGDGKPDIVAVVAPGSLIEDSTVVTLLGAEDGTFRLGTNSGKTFSNLPFVIADFNGDGKKDLLTADGYLSLGNGDGSFGAAVLRLSDAQRGNNIAVADFNGDGKLDLAVVGSGGKSPFISILAGNGDGTFATKAVYAGIRGADFVNVSDIDGDGNLDIVVGLAGPGAYGPDVRTFTMMQFLLGHGDGTFAGAPAIPASGVRGPVFAVADFNGDGFPDLATSQNISGGALLTLYPGSASGRYGSASAPIALAIQPLAIAAGDLNGDGKIDLVAAGSQLIVLSGRGDGSFGAPQSYTVPAVAGQVRNMVLADVNGDGRPDVIVTMEGQRAATGGVFVYVANADGTLKAPVQIDTATNLIALAVADLNGDGRADIVVGGADPQFHTSGKTLNGVRIYRSNADGSFTPTTLQTPEAVFYGAVAIADMNKDGKPDLIFSASDASLQDSVYVALGNGDGSFKAAVGVNHSDGPGVRALAVGDFNGDGNPDLIVAGDSYAELLIGKGDGTLTGSVALTIAGNGSAVVVADLNKDGKTDAVMATTSGIVPLLQTKSVIDSPPPPPPSADFTVTAASATQTVSAGQPASTTITVTPANGFNETVALSCAGLPAGASCSFTPASLVVNGSAITSTVTINTSAKAALAGPIEGWGPGTGTTPAILSAGALLLALGWSLRHSGSGRTRPAWRTVGMVGVIGAGSLLYACGGGGGGGGGGTPPGTSVVTINVAGATVSHTVSFTLVVQ